MDKTLQKKYSGIYNKVSLHFKKLFAKDLSEQKSEEKNELLADIERALADIRYARTCFEEASSPEMIEACIYEIKSAEARYSFLLRKAKLSSVNSNEIRKSKLKI